jgi:hypothetical protein
MNPQDGNRLFRKTLLKSSAKAVIVRWASVARTGSGAILTSRD